MLSELEPIAAGLERTRRFLAELFDPLTVEELDRAPREGEYSGRQVLAHLAGAERGMTRLMQRMVSGENPRLGAEYDNNYYNARQQEKRAGRSAAKLRAELDEARAALLEFMESLTRPDLDKRGEHPVAGDATLAEVLRVVQTHELDHLREFEPYARELIALRAGQRPQGEK